MAQIFKIHMIFMIFENKLILLNIIVFIILCVFLLIIKQLSTKNLLINNFIIAWVNACMFIGLKFYFLIFLRSLNFKKEINLKEQLNICIDFVNQYFNSPILYCLAILNIILIIIIYLKLNKLLRWHFWKFCFYYYMQDYKINNKTLYLYSLSFEHKFSYILLCRELNAYFNKRLSKYLKKELTYNFFTVWVRLILFFILVTIFVSECYLYNYTLKITFIYLFIYVILQQWILISLDINNQYMIANLVLYEQYYCFPEMIFINLSEKQKLALETYLINYKFDANIINQIDEENRFLQKITLNSTYYENEEDSSKKFFLEQLRKDSNNLYYTI